MASLITMYGEDGKSVKVFPVDVPELKESGYTLEPQAVKKAEPVKEEVKEETKEEEAPKRGRGRAAAKIEE